MQPGTKGNPVSVLQRTVSPFCKSDGWDDSTRVKKQLPALAEASLACLVAHFPVAFVARLLWIFLKKHKRLSDLVQRLQKLTSRSRVRTRKAVTKSALAQRKPLTRSHAEVTLSSTVPPLSKAPPAAFRGFGKFSRSAPRLNNKPQLSVANPQQSRPRAIIPTRPTRRSKLLLNSGESTPSGSPPAASTPSAALSESSTSSLTSSPSFAFSISSTPPVACSRSTSVPLRDEIIRLRERNLALEESVARLESGLESDLNCNCHGREAKLHVVAREHLQFESKQRNLPPFGPRAPSPIVPIKPSEAHPQTRLQELMVPLAEFRREFIRGDIIGVGGFSAVQAGQYRGRQVAFKPLLDTNRGYNYGLKCIESEAELLSLDIEGVVKLIAVTYVYREDGLKQTMGLVMEVIEGKPLHAVLASPAVTPVRRLGYLKQLAEIMHRLHTSHHCAIVHRDLKTANMMIRNDDRLVLMDFGLARYEDPEGFVDSSHKSAGTSWYLSPEQLANTEFSRAVDVYAFGIMIPEFFTNRPWFLTKDQKQKELIFPRFSPKSLSDRLEPVSVQCLAVDPNHRPEFATIVDMLSKLIGLYDSHVRLAPLSPFIPLSPERKVPEESVLSQTDMYELDESPAPVWDLGYLQTLGFEPLGTVEGSQFMLRPLKSLSTLYLNVMWTRGSAVGTSNGVTTCYMCDQPLRDPEATVPTESIASEEQTMPCLCTRTGALQDTECECGAWLPHLAIVSYGASSFLHVSGNLLPACLNCSASTSRLVEARDLVLRYGRSVCHWGANSSDLLNETRLDVCQALTGRYAGQLCGVPALPYCGLSPQSSWVAAGTYLFAGVFNRGKSPPEQQPVPVWIKEYDVTARAECAFQRELVLFARLKELKLSCIADLVGWSHSPTGSFICLGRAGTNWQSIEAYALQAQSSEVLAVWLGLAQTLSALCLRLPVSMQYLTQAIGNAELQFVVIEGRAVVVGMRQGLLGPRAVSTATPLLSALAHWTEHANGAAKSGTLEWATVLLETATARVLSLARVEEYLTLCSQGRPAKQAAVGFSRERLRSSSPVQSPSLANDSAKTRKCAVAGCARSQPCRFHGTQGFVTLSASAPAAPVADD